MFKSKNTIFLLLIVLSACNSSVNNNPESYLKDNIKIVSKAMWANLSSNDAYFRYIGHPKEVPDGYPTNVDVFICYTYGDYKYVGQDVVHSDLTGNNYLFNKEKTAILPYELIGLSYDGKFELYSEDAVEYKKFEKILNKEFKGALWMNYVPKNKDEADTLIIKERLKTDNFYRIVFDKFYGPDPDEHEKAPVFSKMTIGETPIMKMFYSIWSQYSDKNEPSILYKLAFENEQFVRDHLCDTTKYDGILLYEKDGHGLVIKKDGPLKSNLDNNFIIQDYVNAKNICDTLVGDWRLPTKDELINIYVNRKAFPFINVNDIPDRIISSTVSEKYNGPIMISFHEFLIWENCFSNEEGFIWPVYSF